jgi:hypothetical protein
MAVTVSTDMVAGRRRRRQTTAAIPPQPRAGLLPHNPQRTLPTRMVFQLTPRDGSTYFHLIDTEMLRVDPFPARLI